MAKKKPMFGVNNYSNEPLKNVQVNTQKVIVNVNPIVRSIVARGGNVVDNYIFLVDCILHADAGI